MTTNALVRAAWKTKVFDLMASAGVNAFDSKVLPETRKERSRAYYGKRIDFWEYLVAHAPVPGMLGAEMLNFEVRITRIIEKDPANLAFNECGDSITETLYPLVKSSLGDTWDGTVQGWNPPEGLPVVGEDNFAEHRVWKCTVVYKGFIQVNY